MNILLLKWSSKRDSSNRSRSNNKNKLTGEAKKGPAAKPKFSSFKLPPEEQTHISNPQKAIWLHKSPSMYATIYSCQ